MIQENIEEIRKYTEKNKDKGIYPRFSIKIDGQWFVGIGSGRFYPNGKLFPCSSEYAKLADYFYGSFWVEGKELPTELSMLLSFIDKVDKTNERVATSQLSKLLHKSGIPCLDTRYNNISPDLALYNGFYLVELKLKFSKNLYSSFLQVACYLRECENAKYCILVELCSKKYFLISKCRQSGHKILESPTIDNGFAKDILTRNICKYCPSYWDRSYVNWYELCDGCPISKTIKYIMSNQNIVNIEFDWVTGKVRGKAKIMSYSEYLNKLLNENRKPIR